MSFAGRRAYLLYKFPLYPGIMGMCPGFLVDVIKLTTAVGMVGSIGQFLGPACLGSLTLGPKHSCSVLLH